MNKFIFCLTVALVPLASWAQDVQIAGFVTDTTGSTVPKARITVTNQSTAAKRTALTNDSGLYSVQLLQPGKYRMTVEASGFETQQREDLTLEVAQNARMDFTLTVGRTETAITVQGGNTMLNTSDGSVNTIVDHQFVENMPLNGRSFQSLLALTPGVVITPVATIGGEQGQFSVAGQRSGSNYFTVDGVSANFAASNGIFESQTTNGGLPAFSALGSTASLVSIDALQEFRIESSTYAPEYGRESGGQVVLVTRSGTNRFHGTAFDYFRNDVLDANDWFANSAAQPKPRERQNDFGGVLGGPITKDKTFFFFSYEGLRVAQPSVQIGDVPSIAARENAPPNIKAILNTFPLPNGPATGNGLSQLAASFSSPSTLDATSFRIDHSFNSNVNLFGRYNHAPSSRTTVGCAGPPNMSCTPVIDTDTATVGVTAILTPTITNDLRFNYSRARGKSSWNITSAGGAIAPSPSALAAPWQDLSTGWFFLYNSSGRDMQLIQGLGANNLNRQVNLTDSVSVAHRAHLMKFGFDLRRLTPVEQHPTTGIGYDWLGATADAFVNGMAPNLSIIQDPNIIRQRFYNFSSFAQDTWKASQRLTLTYGIRWDYNPPPVVTSGNPPYVLSQITNLATASLLPRGTPLWHASLANFAPRIGVSYLLNPNTERTTVLRAGFGQFYDLGTSTGGSLDDGQGFFPYSLVTILCTSGVGPDCSTSVPYNGPKPPFVFTKPYQGLMMAWDPHLKLPYSLQWNVAVEQSISPNQSFKVTYLGSAGRRLLRDDVISKPNPILSGIFLTKNTSYSNYDALQLQFQRRLSHGLQALISYSWSHSLDLSSGDASSPWGGASVGIPSSLYNIKQEYGSSDFDIRHSFSAALTYNIPAPTFKSSFVRTLLRNWSVDSINMARTGLPFHVLYQPADPGPFASPTGGTYYLRPDQISGQPVYTNDPNAPGGKRLNLAAFSIPSVIGQGSEGRNTIRGFPLIQMDLALRRQFNLAENVTLQFRAEGFNIINRPNFGNPSNNLGTCAQGMPCKPIFGWGQAPSMLNQVQPGSAVYENGFGSLYQMGGPRSFQLSMKLQF